MNKFEIQVNQILLAYMQNQELGVEIEVSLTQMALAATQGVEQILRYKDGQKIDYGVGKPEKSVKEFDGFDEEYISDSIKQLNSKKKMLLKINRIG